MDEQFLFHMRVMIVLFAVAAPASTDADIVGKPETTYAPAESQQPLRVPTAVALESSGRVLVLDGAHDRIAIFENDGAFVGELRGFGQERFHQPTGVRVGPDGRIWIADGPNRRVLVGSPDGSLDRIIAVPDGDDGRPADPTDVALCADGAVWIVDNENHRLLQHDVDRDSWMTAGRLGDTLGRFEYPWQIVALPGGDLAVSDVINARVQLFNSRGDVIRSIASFGVEIGELYRPSGVAVDASGQVWVADSVMGVIQVFRADGSLVSVVRDSAGTPLRLEGPLGMAFDPAGALYVVESRANRARRFRIEQTPHTAPMPRAPRRAVPQIGQQSKACTLCHIEWIAPFSEGRDSSLMPRPLSSREEPASARADMCLSCHDGTVSDSRLRVWDQHGHLTGIAPPPEMSIPGHLPLVNGALACRTCHSAHGSDAPQSDFRRAMLLRVPNQASELCASCHVDKTHGPRFGTHPTGGMPWPIPEGLIVAGAKVGPNPRELTCQVCHTPHGAKNDHLLVLGTSSNQLCTSCHDQIRPGMFRDGPHAEHPLTAQVNAEQAEAVRALGTKLGPGERLICLSCHKLHHGRGERFLLADDLNEGQMCLHCHAERREIIGSPHDLRINFPQERNRLGLTASEGGPCSSCHLFHRYARQPVPGSGDAAGHCITCHQTGQCAESKTLGDVNHPSLFCTECHNPHETRHENFLRAKPVDLCTSCHLDQSTLVGGPHDAVAAGAAWCEPDAPPAGPCLGCHRPHGDAETGLFRVPPAAGMPVADGACIACHPGADPARSSALALLHPLFSKPHASGAGHTSVSLAKLGLPLVNHPDHGEIMGCKTCHDPHAGWNSNRALLREGHISTETLCAKCHDQAHTIASTAHSPAALAAHSIDSGACLPCHRVHGDADLVQRDLLWPVALRGAVVTAGESSAMQMTSDVFCTGCHRDGGAATLPQVATHPRVEMLGLAAGAEGLPLYDSDGRLDPQGQITCRTCHTPHGRTDAYPDEFAAIGDRSALASAQRLQLRKFEAPNTCSTCHGAEALWRFLYFHDPARRGGPAQGTR